ncbi:MAG: alanine racemase [Myxococcales bacterium]|nr:alanine racemase [Myxococcales bacterium]
MLSEILEDEQLVRRPTTAFINLSRLKHNLRYIRSLVGPDRKIMAIVKANAYGHGLVPVARALLNYGADQLGVAFLEEGIALRRAGIHAPILVLGGLIGNQVRHFIEYNLQIAAASSFKIEQVDEVASEMGQKAEIHLKVDTGMERLGTHWDSTETLLAAAQRAKHTKVVGVFSHLAESEHSDHSFTKKQIERFQYVVDMCARWGFRSIHKHLANSGGVLYHPDAWFDMVRPGIALYGVPPCSGPSPLQPVLRLVSRIVYFKVVGEGSSVSYNRTWTASEDTRVVTVPVGYGDGYMRALSNTGQVCIRGRRYPVVGNVTMDALMVNLGPQGVGYNGDEVVLIGEDPASRVTIGVHEIAQWSGTIPYEVLTTINTRVPRVYLEEEEESSLSTLA